MLSPMWEHEEPFSDDLSKVSDMYISGLGKIKLTNLVGGSIEVYVYENMRDKSNRIITAKNTDGSDLVFKKIGM